MLKYLLLYIGCFLFFIGTQAQQLGMKNYSNLDGLPSNEVFHSHFDSKGYLWIATNDGVSRFDGEHFVNYYISDGLTENTILEIEEDSHGRIWFVGLSGKLSYFHNGQIKKFKWNNNLLKLKNKSRIISSNGFTPIDTNEIKVLINNGSLIHIKGENHKRYNIFNKDSLCINKFNHQYHTYIRNPIKDSLSLFVKFDSITHCIKIKSNYPNNYIPSYFLYLEYKDHIIYLYQNKAYTIYRDGSYKLKNLDFYPNTILKGAKGGIWIGSYHKGLFFYDNNNLSGDAFLNILENQEITSLIYDQNSRGWVTTAYNGIFHIQSAHVTNYYKESYKSDHFINKILAIDTNTLVFFARNNKIYLKQDSTEQLQELSLLTLDETKVYQAKKYDNKVLLACGTGIIEVPISFFTQTNHPTKGIKQWQHMSSKDFVLQDDVLWIASSTGLYYVLDFNKKKKNILSQLNNLHLRLNKIIKAPEYSTDSTSALIAQSMESQWIFTYPKDSPKDITIKPFKLHDSIPNYAANDLLIDKKRKGLFVATKGSGLFYTAADTNILWTTEHGLLDDNIYVMKWHNDSVLFAGTNNGVNIISFSMDKTPRIKESKFISVNDGLLGKEIHDLCFKDSVLILATDKGISYVTTPEVTSMVDSYSIFLTQFLVNGQAVSFENNSSLKFNYNENNIQITFDAVDFHDKKGIKYYYKLHAEEDWTETKESVVVFPTLPSGDYYFQVKAQNSYLFNSKNIATVHFSVDEVFYKTTWFALLMSIIFFGILTTYIYYNYKNDTEKIINQAILADYHQQSLVRSMNPHFIFNALNSVNSSIINNRKKEAVFHISQIAILIRQIFNSARTTTIEIKKEASLLDSYLKIEQRRLTYPFQYVILVKDNLEQEHIPSFMIQIFVENSIWHGFSDKKGKGAMISIVFQKKQDYIVCEVIDNGIGREKAEENKKKQRQSKHGIDIIKERIDLLNKRKNKRRIELLVEDLLKPITLDAVGTKVQLWFPLDN